MFRSLKPEYTPTGIFRIGSILFPELYDEFSDTDILILVSNPGIFEHTHCWDDGVNYDIWHVSEDIQFNCMTNPHYLSYAHWICPSCFNDTFLTTPLWCEAELEARVNALDTEYVTQLAAQKYLQIQKHFIFDLFKTRISSELYSKNIHKIIIAYHIVTQTTDEIDWKQLRRIKRMKFKSIDTTDIKYIQDIVDKCIKLLYI